MLEKPIESWSKRVAIREGWWVRKFQAPGRRAVPDDIFGKAGRIFFVEFKATGKVPTALQLEEHKKMAEGGLIVYVCDSREQFREILDFENFLC